MQEQNWKIVHRVSLEIDQPRVLVFAILMSKKFGPDIHIVPNHHRCDETDPSHVENGHNRDQIHHGLDQIH